MRLSRNVPVNIAPCVVHFERENIPSRQSNKPAATGGAGVPFQAFPGPYSLTPRRSAVAYNPKWRNGNHFANCSNFEQTLLKLMTRQKRWSTSLGSG
jgi:hypothetical protein